MNDALNPADPSAATDLDPERERLSRQWAMLLHLSVFVGHLSAGAGLVAPIVIWQIKKADYPELDQHGRNVANWLISLVIYSAISLVLIFAFIGFPLLIILGVLSVVFPIIGGVKASNGEVWKYPLALRFL